MIAALWQGELPASGFLYGGCASLDVWITWRETRQRVLPEASVSILSKEGHNAARRHLVRLIGIWNSSWAWHYDSRLTFIMKSKKAFFIEIVYLCEDITENEKRGAELPSSYSWKCNAEEYGCMPVGRRTIITLWGGMEHAADSIAADCFRHCQRPPFPAIGHTADGCMDS